MNYIIIISTGILGALLTYFASINLKQGAVRASALLSLIVGLFFYFFPPFFELNIWQQIPVIFFGASFAGMVSDKVIQNYFWVILSGILFSIIYIITGDFFSGFGGGLGTTACISIVICVGLQRLFSKKSSK